MHRLKHTKSIYRKMPGRGSSLEHVKGLERRLESKKAPLDKPIVPSEQTAAQSATATGEQVTKGDTLISSETAKSIVHAVTLFVVQKYVVPKTRELVDYVLNPPSEINAKLSELKKQTSEETFALVEDEGPGIPLLEVDRTRGLPRLPKGCNYVTKTDQLTSYSSYKDAFGSEVIFDKNQCEQLLGGAKKQYILHNNHKSWNPERADCREYVLKYLEGAKYYSEQMGFKMEDVVAHLLGAKIETIRFVKIPKGSNVLLCQQNQHPKQKTPGSYFAPIGQHPYLSGHSGHIGELHETSGGKIVFGRVDRLCQSDPSKEIALLESETAPIEFKYAPELSYAHGYVEGGGTQWVVPKEGFHHVPNIPISNDGFKLIEDKGGRAKIEYEEIMAESGRKVYGNSLKYHHTMYHMHETYGASAPSSTQLSTVPGLRPVKGEDESDG